MPEQGLRRHDLVWVQPAAWATMMAAAPGRPEEPLLIDWAARGWPVIARRPLCDDPAGLVPVGLPLPPAAGKQRLAFALPPDAITRVAPPPLLADVMPAAPVAWSASIDRLLGLDARVRVYGSLAWQHLTGLGYLTDSSDLDLLWLRQDEETTRALLMGLSAIDDAAPMRIDGELVGTDGTAVNWRELLSGAAEVLAKRLDALLWVGATSFIAGRVDA